MKRATIINQIVRGRRCKHIHLSGRRCAARVFGAPEHILCELHRRPCEECLMMRRSFQPKKGWPDGMAQ